MADETRQGDATSTATDDDVKRVDQDTEQNPSPGAAVDSQGVGANPTDSTDPDENQDPKSGHSPV